MNALSRYLQEDDHAEMFVPPSDEATRLVKHLGWLVAPADGKGGLLSRAIGVMVVAPFTQFTFFSYDLQAFLYEIFHTRIWARLGHFVFMPVVNFSVMVALAQLRVGPHPASHTLEWLPASGATVYGLVLLLWYALMAAHTRMWLWWVAMVPVVAALTMGANALYGQTFVLDPAARTWYAPVAFAFNPFLWMAVGAFLIALSHAPEPRLPPRVTQSRKWQSVPDYVLGPRGQRVSPGTACVRAARVALQSLWGTLDEWWASPRLMPYGFLLLMFKAGYQPQRKAELDAYVRKAIASGNPALDYVGIGGGTFLRQPDQAAPVSDRIGLSAG